ncbi:hypothetical protein JCM18237_01080 [Halorubrum luteum]
MGLDGAGVIERGLRKLLAPVCVLSGIVVVSGYFFPEIVGETVSGPAWLVVSLLFFGSGLAYLAVLPAREENEEAADEAFDPEYLLRVRRAGVSGLLRGFLARQDRMMFGVPVALFALFFAGQLLAPSRTFAVVGAVEAVVTAYGGPVFVAVVALSVACCLALLVGPWGSIRLGGSDAEPAYTYPVYFTMFFTAGIAAGIVFWGPAEALFHYDAPPPLFDVEPRSAEAITPALTYALFHWGISAWSAYVVLGVPIAYFVYQRGAPLRVSSVLTPFFGVENLGSRWCRLVDTLAVFATIGGIATSIAFVSQQFLTGTEFQWGVPFGTVGMLLFVTGLTLVFVASAQSGVDRGIRRIAAVNIVLFALFGLIFLAIAPRAAVVEYGRSALGSYAANFLVMSAQMSGEWTAGWTVWNWAWWFSWAPFAGLFLAALSRGRTIRTVVATGFLATSAATLVWFLLLGSTSLHLQHTGVVDVLAAVDAYGGSEAVAGFPVFETLPLSRLLMFLFLALIVVFIVTSADTSTLVVAVLATERDAAPTTSGIVFWGVFQGVVAVSVLATDSAEPLQAMAVLAGGPFAVVALVAVAGLAWTLRDHDVEYPAVEATLPTDLSPQAAVRASAENDESEATDEDDEDER